VYETCYAYGAVVRMEHKVRMLRMGAYDTYVLIGTYDTYPTYIPIHIVNMLHLVCTKHVVQMVYMVCIVHNCVYGAYGIWDDL